MPLASMVADAVRLDRHLFSALRSSPPRAQIRRQQIAELMRYCGFGTFGQAATAGFLPWLMAIEQLRCKASQCAHSRSSELCSGQFEH